MALSAKDLRIGNLIYNIKNEFDKRQIIVSGITSTMIACKQIVTEHKFFEPIPLTEEWLLKAGFVFKNGGVGWDTYILKDLVLTLVPTNNGKVICYCYNTSKYKPIKSVHDFQNLFFSLTGEELVFSN